MNFHILYNSGARTIALFGLGSTGCTPDAIDSYGTNGSYFVDDMNNAFQVFNITLKLLVDKLKSDLADAKFIYINSHGKGEMDALVTVNW